jgi:hypothetical protein
VSFNDCGYESRQGVWGHLVQKYVNCTGVIKMVRFKNKFLKIIYGINIIKVPK